MKRDLRPCPCCGFLVFDGPPGTHDICPICNWEDDRGQLDDPTFAGGANRVSLMEAQENYRAFGASIASAKSRVRAPGPGDVREPGFEPFDPKRHPKGGYWWRC